MVTVAAVWPNAIQMRNKNVIDVRRNLKIRLVFLNELMLEGVSFCETEPDPLELRSKTKTAEQEPGLYQKPRNEPLQIKFRSFIALVSTILDTGGF